MQWRAGIGNYYRYAYPLINMKKSLLSFNFDISLILLNLFYSLFYQILLLLHGDVETNPGPNKKYNPFTCCHWNVNSLIAHNMVKLSSIAASNTIHKYDFICISETYLDSSSNVSYVKSLLIIKKAMLQFYIDLPAKIVWNLIISF